MAYGRWLYKEIETKQGSISLAIYKKNYTGNAIEIDALVADSIVISIDGDGITAPIIGSSLSFSIIDTGQIDTSEFFTPDATMYRIDLSRDGTLEWSGYLTPDSYQESLSYRDNINLIARDNLGRLEEFQFLESKGLQNIETFIADLLSEIGCPQVINWDVRKVSIAKGKDISEVTDCDDIWVNTELFVGKDYKEIVEMILTGLGCQMRYNGYNNLIITSLSDIPSLPTQSAIFINKSGFKEILPAWKDVTITQDYGLIENFFDGYFSKEQVGSSLTFVPSVQMSDKWIIDRGLSNLIFANPYKWSEGIEDGAEESIFPALSKASSAIWKKQVKGSSNMIELKMQLNNTLRRLSNSAYNGIGNLFCGSNDTEDHILEYELTYQFLVSYVDSTGKEKFMSRYGWVDIDDGVDLIEYIFTPINFTTSPCKWDDEGTWDQEQEVTISINNLTEDGELRIYIGNVTWGEKNEVPDNVFFGKIRDIRIAYKLDNGEIASRLQVSDKHNINGRVELEIGQVPVGKGDYLAYAGGFFDSQGLPLTNFKRYYDDINNYILMELVAREHIHFNKDNYMALSGDMISDSPFSFRNNIIYKGERYVLISASLAVISNTLSVTNMLQVTDYEVAELTVIDSPLESSSGTKVGSGSRQVIQFSNDAGNAKRLYELDFAMDGDDIDNAYAIVDTDRWQEAKRVKVSELGGLFNKAFEVVTDDAGNVTAVIAKANLGARGGIAARYQGNWGDIPVTPTINSLGDITDVTITSPTNGQGLVYRDGVWVNEVISGGSGDYLPITGGVLNGNLQIGDDDNTAYRELSIKRNGVTTYIATTGAGEASFNVTYADGVGHSLLLRSDAALYYNGSDYHYLLHSGNTNNYFAYREWSNQDANTASMGANFTYANNAPFTGPLATFSCGGYDLQLNGGYGAAGMIAYRTKNGDNGTWNSWRQLVDDGNIGSYNAGSADVIAKTYYDQSINFARNESKIRLISSTSGDAFANGFPSQYVSGISVLSNYVGWQMVTYGGDAENPYFRSCKGDNNWKQWKQLAFLTDNVASAQNLTHSNGTLGATVTSGGNVLVGTTEDSSAKLRIQTNRADTFTWNLGNLASKSDIALEFYHNSNIYGLYTAINYYSGDVAMQVGRSDGLTYAYNLCLQLLGGNVGIGTANPLYKTDIKNNTHANYDFHTYNSATNSSFYVGYSALWYGTSLKDTADGVFVVNVGCQYDGGGGTPAMQIRANKSAEFYGNISASGGITAKTSSSSSDARLKDNITLLSQEDAINILMALKPSSWNWKDGGELAYGLVAQDVESVLPCSVTYGESLSLQYNMFHAFEISVGQNHETRLQYLERENKELKKELQTLKREYYGNR